MKNDSAKERKLSQEYGPSEEKLSLDSTEKVCRSSAPHSSFQLEARLEPEALNLLVSQSLEKHSPLRGCSLCSEAAPLLPRMSGEERSYDPLSVQDNHHSWHWVPEHEKGPGGTPAPSSTSAPCSHLNCNSALTALISYSLLVCHLDSHHSLWLSSSPHLCLGLFWII